MHHSVTSVAMDTLINKRMQSEKACLSHPLLTEFHRADILLSTHLLLRGARWMR